MPGQTTARALDREPSAEELNSGNPFVRLRARARRTRSGRLAWRIGAGVVGTLIILGGILLLPLPGPGWLIIFAGLGVLATEFDWAKRLLSFARRQVARWSDWIKHQPRWLQALVGLAGLILLVAVVAFCYWLYLLIK